MAYECRLSATLTDPPAHQAPRRPMPLMAAMVAFALTTVGAIAFGLATAGHNGDGAVEVAASVRI